MFCNSTRVILIPHGSVATSRIDCSFELIVSRDVNVSSSSKSPIKFLSVVAVKCSIAASGFSTPYVNSFGLVILKNTIESICIVTLSFVITGCGGKSATCSFNETRLATRSKIGILKCNPFVQVILYEPRNSITYAVACGTILIQFRRKITTSTTIGIINGIKYRPFLVFVL